MSPHDVQQIQADLEPEMDLEKTRDTNADIEWCPQPPLTLDRVLHQICVPLQDEERGTSLHSRQGNPETPKGSQQITRKSGQEMATVI